MYAAAGNPRRTRPSQKKMTIYGWTLDIIATDSFHMLRFAHVLNTIKNFPYIYFLKANSNQTNIKRCYSRSLRLALRDR